ncbi:MAG: hypothetical protein GX864_02350, partial [Mollicutes bacterium]|nr:hypothetical protein [Mollicutes bacterium]
MKKTIFIIEVLVIIVGITFVILKYGSKNGEDIKSVDLTSEIKANYNEFVKSNKEAKLYRLNKNEYEESGMVSKDIVLHLDEFTNNKYYKLKNMDYYINYLDVVIS